MIARTCDIVQCPATTRDDAPGASWIRLGAVAFLLGDSPTWKTLDACGPAHAHELVDELGERL